MRAGSTSRRGDESIALLAECQHGHVARRQLLELGLSSRAIGIRLEAGRLRPVYRGVYAVGHRPQTQLSRFMAAVLAAGVDAVLSHRSAAALWAMSSQGSGPIHVSAPRKVCRDGRIRGHQSRIAPDETTILEAIPVTGVSRTLFDLAATAGAAAFHAALREAEYRRLTDGLTLADLLARYPRRRGAPLIRAALASDRFGPAKFRSGFERRFLAFLDARGLPLPVINGLIEAGGETYEVDAHWPPARLVAELDDPHSHGTQAAFEADRLRDRALLLAGWRTIRITDKQLRLHPDALEHDLRALLALPSPLVD